MTRTARTRTVSDWPLDALATALVVGIALGAVSPTLAQAPEPAAELLTVVGDWEGPDKLGNDAAIEGLAVEIRSGVLDRATPRLSFQGFGGRFYEATLERLERPAAGGTVWIGRVDGFGEHSRVLLAQVEGYVSGYLDTPEARYEITPRPGGHVMIKVDSSRFGGCRVGQDAHDDDHHHPVPAAEFENAALTVGLDPARLWERAQKADKSTVILDILVVFSSTVADALGGHLATGSLASSVIATLDDAFVSSGVQARARLRAYSCLGSQTLNDSSGNDQGLVNVLYSNASGVTNVDQIWHQARGSLGAVANNGDRYGDALAVGDFDNDGKEDLAIGIPGEDIDGKTDTGAVQVLYGASGGLSSTDFDYFHQGAPGVLRNDEHGDEFGASLAVGDFDGDGYDDLAIGRPGEHIGVPQAGAINVLYGASGGITTSGDQAFQQENLQLTNQVEDRFGEALAAGDFDGDGYDDLAIGIPGNINEIGKVTVMFGSSGGLNSNHFEHLDQASPFALASLESGDRFGEALAVGDFNGDTYDDLAVGVPYEDLGSSANAGMIHVFFGGSTGFEGAPRSPQTMNQSYAGGSVEANDSFGKALAAGDLDGDGYDDLAVSAPYEDSNDIGRVHLLWGSSSQLVSESQSIGGSDGSHAGRSLAIGDFDGDGYDDLAIGRPWANDYGDVLLYHGRASGFPEYQRSWKQYNANIQGEAETGDEFGLAVAIGDFNGGGKSDLAVGAPGESVSDESTIFIEWVRESSFIANVRDNLSIDLVGLVVDNLESSICGSAQEVLDSTAGDSSVFVQVTKRSCAVGNLTFAHEIGHLIGLAHDPANAGDSGACSDARGHYVSGKGRTLMSYSNQCSNNNCTRVGLISNPDVDFSFGDPSGISGSRDNARCADLAVGNVASYRN